MPSLRGRVIAVVASDIHLSHNPPPARAGEPNWYDAMRRPLSQLRALGQTHDAPIFIAGDIFDHWRSPPELINFAIEAVPPCYAIPGQHDLPNHSAPDLKRSAYWTLLEAGNVQTLTPGEPTKINGAWYYGYPWGCPPVPVAQRQDNELQIAIVHAYIWAKQAGYAGAPEDARLPAWLPKLAGYDVAFFGDNHKGFSAHQVFNCGGFMRRKSDEADYRPAVGLLFDDGTTERCYLDCGADAFQATANDTALPPELNLDEFFAELQSLRGTGLDFTEACRRYCGGQQGSPAARAVLASVMGF